MEWDAEVLTTSFFRVDSGVETNSLGDDLWLNAENMVSVFFWDTSANEALSLVKHVFELLCIRL